MLQRFGRRHVVAHSPVEADADDVAIADPAPVVAVHACDGAFRDLHETQVGVAGRGSESHVERDLVERGADRVGHHRSRFGEDLAFPAHALGEAGRLGSLREAHCGLGARRFVGRAVHRLGDADLVDPLAGAGQHHADQIGHTGMGAAAEDRGIAFLASLPDAFQIFGDCLPPVIHAALEHTLTPASSSRVSSSMFGHSGL